MAGLQRGAPCSCRRLAARPQCPYISKTMHQPDLRSDTQPKIARHWWNWEDVLLIVVVASALYLPGLFHVPLFDRDEPRFASAAREMLRSGNFIVPRFDGVLRPDKPPVIYWLMDISYRIFGVHGGSARLPSAVSSLLTLLVVYFMAGKRFGRAVGLLAALVLSVSILFFVESRLATADATMILFTTVAMAKLWDAWDARARVGLDSLVIATPAAMHSTDPLEFLRDADSHPPRSIRWWDVIIFWVAMGLGILTKGVTPIFVFATAITLSVMLGWPKMQPAIAARGNGAAGKLGRWIRNLGTAVRGASWRWFGSLRPLWGIVLLCAVVLPWFIAAWLATHGQLIERMINQNLIKRTTSGLQSHGEPPGFFLATIWATFWPWSVLLVPAGFHAVRRARRLGPIAFDPSGYQFLLCWIIPSWLLFETFVTKLVQYDLPLFIPLAILCADTMVQSWHRLTDVLSAGWFAAARWVWSGIWVLLGAACIGACWWVFLPDHPLEFNAFIPAAVALAATGVVGALAWNRPAWPLLTILGFGLSLLLLNTVALPRVKGLDLSRRAGHEMAIFASQGYHLGAVGYIEPSLVFYAGGHVALFSSPPQMIKTVGLKWRVNKPATTLALRVSAVRAGATGTPAAPMHGMHRPAVASASTRMAARGSRWCVAVDQRTLEYLRAHHIGFTRIDWFSGVKAAKGKLTRVTIITNTVRPH